MFLSIDCMCYYIFKGRKKKLLQFCQIKEKFKNSKNLLRFIFRF